MGDYVLDLAKLMYAIKVQSAVNVVSDRKNGNEGVLGYRSESGPSLVSAQDQEITFIVHEFSSMPLKGNIEPPLSGPMEYIMTYIAKAGFPGVTPGFVKTDSVKISGDKITEDFITEVKTELGVK